jgi:hypothetical protein
MPDLPAMMSESQGGSPKVGTRSQRVVISLDDRQLGALKWIAQKKGMSMSQVLKQAIELEGYLLDRQEQGARIVVEDRWGRKEQLRPSASKMLFQT